MSAYSDAQLLLERLKAYVTVNEPSVSWAQLGIPVMTCESLALGVVTSRVEQLFPGGGMTCQEYEVLDLVVGIARDCSFEGDDDGNTDPAQVALVSEQQDADLTALKAWVESLPKPADTLTNHTFSSEGGLAFTTTSTSVYGGWVAAEESD